MAKPALCSGVMKNGHDPTSSRPPSGQELRAEATRTQILDAAEKLFAERGFAGTSMRTLAVAAGTSQALLHHHFGTKAGLYEAVKVRFNDRYVAEQGEVDHELDPESVLAEVRHYFRFLQENPHLSRLVAWAWLEGDEAPWGGWEIIWGRLRRWLDRAKEQGLLAKHIDPGLFMVMGAASVQYWFDHRDVLCRTIGLDASDPSIDERYLAHTVQVLLSGVVARPGGAD
jgi:TetR/AcrR family transcriptional regulator